MPTKPEDLCSCLCELKEAVVDVTVRTNVGARRLIIPMAVACRSQRLNDRIPSSELGTKFSFRAQEGDLECWLVCSRVLMHGDCGGYHQCALLGRCHWELHRFLNVRYS